MKRLGMGLIYLVCFVGCVAFCSGGFVALGYTLWHLGDVGWVAWAWSCALVLAIAFAIGEWDAEGKPR